MTGEAFEWLRATAEKGGFDLIFCGDLDLPFAIEAMPQFQSRLMRPVVIRQVSRADVAAIVEGMRDWTTALCRQDPDSFAEFTKSATPAYAHLFTPAVGDGPAPEPKSRAYDEAEPVICIQLGIEPGTLLES